MPAITHALYISPVPGYQTELLMKTLRLILGDQLNHQHPWLEVVNDQITYVLMEVRSETDYVHHHIQKVTAIFLAMRAFAKHLEQTGHQVKYLRLDDADNRQNFPDNLSHLLKTEGFERFEFQLPDEYRLDQILNEFAAGLDIKYEVSDSHHFLTEREEMARFFHGRKTYLMERFYRNIRKQTGYLMDGLQPVTGEWNYDIENRNKYKGEAPVPEFPWVSHDASAVCDLLEANGVRTIGKMKNLILPWAVTRQEGLEWLDFFCTHLLPHFGKFQDAMSSDYDFLFHARLSFLMNVKLLSPTEVVQAAEAKWREDPEKYGIAQVEGFIRQIIGWREYMRGIYWAKMPKFALHNYFGHSAGLPSWFWTGQTRMKCLSESIHNSLDHAYAHHIQRLMVIGNFSLLLGVDPDEINAWFLGIYIDAFEWVEITNTRGMSQYADGGIVGSKPYVASANYINKMSDYCKGCHYKKSDKVGEQACPFNSLYWDFYERHRSLLENNPRIGMVYRTWDRIEYGKKVALLERASFCKTNVEIL